MRAIFNAKQAAFMTIAYSSFGVTGLGENHGYRFDGDFVHINADINFSDADLDSDASWALQLWANEGGFSANEPAGVMIAEQAIYPMAGGIVVNALRSAIPPAGAAVHSMALALVSTTVDGLSKVRDLAVYNARESFFQPRLIGNVSCAVADGVAKLCIDAVVNPRAEDNLSGTLSLEVWALDTPYAGRNWVGTPVASVVAGILGGGKQWIECQYEVPAAMPADGAALTIMLREWTPAGYVTRDYRNLPVAPAKAAPVAKPTSTAKTKAASGKSETKETGLADVKVQAKPAKKAKEKAVAAKTVSINKASEAELTAVQGMSPAMAKAIVAARPYAKLEDVSKAKGMGPKMLEKLRKHLAL